MRDPNKISSRAKLFWQRLTQWYGTRIVEQYGSSPPPDWCAIVDAATDETMRKALGEIKQKHISHPPSFPEFDAIVARSIPQSSNTSKIDVLDQLTKFIYARHDAGIAPLTPYQIAAIPRWTVLVREFDAPDISGKIVRNHAAEVIGVVIHPDGNHTGYRVMVEDMQLAHMAAA